MANTQKFMDMLAFGAEGEHEIAEMLIKRGYNVMPLYQFEPSHAPYILTLESKLISPDLISFKNCNTAFVEVKTKNQWVEFKGTKETGINKRAFNDYKKIKDATGIKVYLFFNHKIKEPEGVFFCEIDQFTRIWDGKVKDKQVYDPMVFYDKTVLNLLTNC